VGYERHDVVRVPFPFTDTNTSKRRPALILSDAMNFNTPSGHSVMAMITSRSHAPWPLDCPIEHLESAGLPFPSMVRFKLFTLDDRLVLGKLGNLADDDRRRVLANLNSLFAFPPT